MWTTRDVQDDVLCYFDLPGAHLPADVRVRLHRAFVLAAEGFGASVLGTTAEPGEFTSNEPEAFVVHLNGCDVEKIERLMSHIVSTMEKVSANDSVSPN